VIDRTLRALSHAYKALCKLSKNADRLSLMEIIFLLVFLAMRYLHDKICPYLQAMLHKRFANQQRFKKVFIFFIGMIIASLAVSAPKASSNTIWQSYRSDSTQKIDHSKYQQFLNTYLFSTPRGINLVAYARVDQKGKQLLNSYINDLAGLDITQYQRNEQLAFWINLYNALTLRVVLEHYPVKSIRDINIGGWFSRGPWKKKLLAINGIQLSLDDIEHRIIRPIWQDSRTHYALNCASYSCPNLQKTAYTADDIDNLLTQAARQYVNSPRGVTISHHKLILSSIYKWYQDDFGGSEQAVINSISQYAQPKLKEQLSNIHSVESYHYDWSLNGLSD